MMKTVTRLNLKHLYGYECVVKSQFITILLPKNDESSNMFYFFSHCKYIKVEGFLSLQPLYQYLDECFHIF